MILRVGADLRMRLSHAAELGLPVAVQNHPVDMAASGAGFPPVGFRSIEANMLRRAHGVVRIKQRFNGALADEFPRDPGGDAVAGRVR